MTTTWYKASGAVWNPKIEPKEVVAELARGLKVLEGGIVFRYAKETQDCAYFPTWKEAHEYLVQACNDALMKARERVLDAQKRFDKVVGMVEP